MANNILKEAIADAKAVRQVALANAKAALEEAFTPKLQSMLSAKLSEDLDEDYYDEDMDEDMDEMDMDEMDMDEMDMDEMNMDMEGTYDEDMESEDSMDEELDLEDLLNELELDEDDEEDDDLEEAVGYPNYRADQGQKVKHDADDINQGLNENKEFDLDSLLEEINSLDETTETSTKEGHCAEGQVMSKEGHCMEESKVEEVKKEDKPVKTTVQENQKLRTLRNKLNEVQASYYAVKAELNEVNLLNSKLLYVNRIFKANNLDDSQKLRVVETLDKADSIKEAKLIYETIKDTFSVAKSKKGSVKSKTKSLREGIGMASKAAGLSTAPKKEVISESTNMMKRFQKLANININQ